MQQVGQTQPAGPLGITVLQRGHQRPVLLLVFKPALGRGAAALQRAPLTLRSGLVDHTEHAGHEAVVRRVGNRAVQFTVPVLEDLQRGGRFGLGVAIVHARKVSGRGVANHHLDQRRLQHQPCAHQLGRADSARRRAGRLRGQAGQCGLHLVADVGAATHGLCDQALALEILQHPPHGGPADAVLPTQRTLGRDAVAGTPLARPQVLGNRLTQQRSSVHGIGIGWLQWA